MSNLEQRVQHNIRDMREQKGMTQRELAAIMQVSHVDIHRIETGERRITITWLERFAVAFKINPKKLL